jgi:2-polyprenyl-3-methyl-5-hydroxy-6-metoxy-1,4-benzoquinol methylase
LSDNEALDAARALWDNAAATFDNEPDHGLRDPRIREAWHNLLARWLPHAPKSVLYIGCGTGSLSVLMAELGYEVTGTDLSPAMIAQAKAKTIAAGQQIAFHVMDAAHPQFAPQSFDAIVCRHLLWSLPQPAQVLERWITLLVAGGRLILIEGHWKTGAGLRVQDVIELLPSSCSNVTVRWLSDDPRLWGGEVNDERYIVIADCL